MSNSSQRRKGRYVKMEAGLGWQAVVSKDMDMEQSQLYVIKAGLIGFRKNYANILSLCLISFDGIFAQYWQVLKYLTRDFKIRIIMMWVIVVNFVHGTNPNISDINTGRVEVSK